MKVSWALHKGELARQSSMTAAFSRSLVRSIGIEVDVVKNDAEGLEQFFISKVIPCILQLQGHVENQGDGQDSSYFHKQKQAQAIGGTKYYVPTMAYWVVELTVTKNPRETKKCLPTYPKDK